MVSEVKRIMLSCEWGAVWYARRPVRNLWLLTHPDLSHVARDDSPVLHRGT